MKRRRIDVKRFFTLSDFFIFVKKVNQKKESAITINTAYTKIIIPPAIDRIMISNDAWESYSADVCKLIFKEML